MKKKQHGGKREGSGRPKLKKSQKKESTKVIRVPLSKLKPIKNWISGIYLHSYTTNLPNGTLAGWDADYGEMVAYNGKLISSLEYNEIHST